MGCESASAFCGPYSLKRIGSGRNLSFFRDHTPPYHRFDQIRQSIQAALGAFAALRADGSVVTWGDPGGGGDSSSVQSQLCNVCQVQSSGLAFAAIKADGSVVTWGSPSYGGDCSAVRDQLYSMQQIQSNYVAFAALRADGNVVTWGETDSSAVRDELQEGVLSIYAQDFMGFMGPLLAHEFGMVLGFEVGFRILDCRFVAETSGLSITRVELNGSWP